MQCSNIILFNYFFSFLLFFSTSTCSGVTTGATETDVTGTACSACLHAHLPPQECNCSCLDIALPTHTSNAAKCVRPKPKRFKGTFGTKYPDPFHFLLFSHSFLGGPIHSIDSFVNPWKDSPQHEEPPHVDLAVLLVSLEQDGATGSAQSRCKNSRTLLS